MYTTVDDIRKFFREKKKQVITFAGFGELGYQEDGIVERIAREVLLNVAPDKVIVNSGTMLRKNGNNGIADIYAFAAGMGFETSGIHPGIALDYRSTHWPSPSENHVFYIDDSSWGGFLDEQQSLSPTLAVILNISDELVVIGGGKHAADELTAFLKRGKKVRYYEAEMNHIVTRDWSESADVEVVDMRGAAYHIWHKYDDGRRP